MGGRLDARPSKKWESVRPVFDSCFSQLPSLSCLAARSAGASTTPNRAAGCRTSLGEVLQHVFDEMIPTAGILGRQRTAQNCVQRCLSEAHPDLRTCRSTIEGSPFLCRLCGKDFGATQDNLTARLKREAFVETRLRNRACESHSRGPADRRVWDPPAAIACGVRPRSRHRTEFS